MCCHKTHLLLSSASIIGLLGGSNKRHRAAGVSMWCVGLGPCEANMHEAQSSSFCRDVPLAIQKALLDGDAPLT